MTRNTFITRLLGMSVLLSSSSMVLTQEKESHAKHKRKHSALITNYAIPITAGIITGCGAASLAQYLTNARIYGDQAITLQRAFWLITSFYGCNSLRNIIIEENVSQSDDARTNGFLATIISFACCALRGK